MTPLSNRTVKPTSFFHRALLFVLCAAGCTHASNQQADNPARLLTVEARPQSSFELNELLTRVRLLEESLPLLACGPELRALFREIRTNCENAAPSSGSEGDGSGIQACGVKEIKGTLSSTQRDLSGTTTKNIGYHLMSLLRHEVVYVGPNGSIVSKRQERLKALANERRLPSTRFLLVASGPDAAQRSRSVQEYLEKNGLEEAEAVFEGSAVRRVSRFDVPWNYPLRVELNEMKVGDRPMPLEPHGLDRAVFVFRTECQ